MSRYFKLTVFANLLFFCGTAYSAIPNTDNPTTFLGPTMRGGFTGLLTDTSGYSFAGEAGFKNVRMSGTAGFGVYDNHRVKLSAEYLGQDINYPFFAGNVSDWVNQVAVGATYQYQFNQYRYRPQVELNATYADSASSGLGTQTGTYITSGGVSQPYTNMQRVADSHASSVSPGVIIHPWWGSNMGVELNYDNVRYDTKYIPSKTTKGLGGTAHVNQLFPQQIEVGMSAAFREPYNNYQADIGWNRVPYFEEWELKLTGAYTVGKESLPDTYNIGLSADYYLDRGCGLTPSEQTREEILTWIAKPAVYVPQVLAIVDESVT